MLLIQHGGQIIVSGRDTGLGVGQTSTGTQVFTRENVLTGTKYKLHTMPHDRYSTSHKEPSSGCAGSEDFERDVLAILENITGNGA
jgi:hypothetical protein